MEFIYDGIPLEISNNIFFGKYKEENILEKFRQMCQTNSPKNEGILVPAQVINSNQYLQGLGPVKKKTKLKLLVLLNFSADGCKKRNYY